MRARRFRFQRRGGVVYLRRPMTTGHTFAAPQPPADTVREHVGRTLRLALPVMVARAGVLVLVAVDIAMTGRAGAVELAYYGLAMAPQVPMMLVGIGLLMGTVVMTAQAEGAGSPAECGAVWRVALVHAVTLGVLFMALSQAGEWFLALVGQAPDLARGGGRVLVMFGWSLPAVLLYTATTFFLEGINRPAAGVVVMVFANLLNFALNWLFIYGNGGAPAMGAEGAALATTLARWFMFLAIATYALLRVDRARYGIHGAIADARALGRRLRRIGYPMGLGLGLETGSFAAMTLFAGLLGPTQVAAYQVAMSLVAVVFMCAIGFATAASVRVGNAVGRRDQGGVRLAGWVALGLAASVLAAFGIVFRSVPDALVGVYTSEPAVIAVAIPTVLVAGLILVFDGAQAVLMGALRGIADVWPATALYFICFWLVMVPAGYLLGVARAGGAPALMVAVGVGCAAAVVSLALRFHVVSRRAVARA
ncbi:MAG: MATE family efflux transporter [Alphaproteobacteria bacterium]